MYFSPDQLRFLPWRRFLNSFDYDILYLNSFFSSLTIQTLLLRRLRQIPSIPIIIAPRGQFSPGAMQFSRKKKFLYLWFAGSVGLYRGLIWQASSEFEVQDIQNIIARFNLDNDPIVLIAPNLPPPLSDALQIGRQPAKHTGSLRLVFLSRLARKKNLEYALNSLQNVKGDVHFDIYGPIEDVTYWQECQEIIPTLPPGVKVTYRGSVLANEVKETFGSYHAFLFPTWGENFGHVILEALSVGCPVLISDQTPWCNLAAQKAGWDLPLEPVQGFQHVLDYLVSMEQNEWAAWSTGARHVAETFSNDPAIVEANRRLFYTALAGKEERKGPKQINGYK